MVKVSPENSQDDSEERHVYTWRFKEVSENDRVGVLASVGPLKRALFEFPTEEREMKKIE